MCLKTKKWKICQGKRTIILEKLKPQSQKTCQKYFGKLIFSNTEAASYSNLSE